MNCVTHSYKVFRFLYIVYVAYMCRLRSTRSSLIRLLKTYLNSFTEYRSKKLIISVNVSVIN